MTLALTKGHPVVTAGLAAITGSGVALGFTVLDSTTSTWLLILATVIPLETRTETPILPKSSSS